MARLIPETFLTKNGLQVELRSCEDNDWNQIVQLMNQIKHESTFTYQFPEQPSYTEVVIRNRIKGFLESQRKMQIGGFYNGQLIAQVDWQPYHSNENHPWLKHNATFGMSILKEFWGQGIGFRLLQLLERESRAMGYQQIFAEVRSSNEGGRHLYAKFGFEITGSRPSMAFIENKYYDDLIIYKKLY